MRSRDRIRQPAALRQASLVKSNAAYVILIGQDGTVTSWVNEHARLEVIAVIGPAENSSDFFEGPCGEVILMEIGMNRTRPYKEVHIPADQKLPDDPLCFWTRFDKFQITPFQYNLAAPFIFNFLEERAAMQISTRKRGWDPYKINSYGLKDKITIPVLKKNNGRLTQVNVTYGKFPKVRYTVSLLDELIVNDLYWAELCANEFIYKNLHGMGKYMQRMLSKALRARKAPKNWFSNNYYSAAIHHLDRFIRSPEDKVRNRKYLQKLVLRDHIGRLNYFYDEIAQYLDWDDSEPIEEEVHALNALPNPQDRVRGVQIQIWRKFNGLLAFDVYPRKDDLPF